MIKALDGEIRQGKAPQMANSPGVFSTGLTRDSYESKFLRCGKAVCPVPVRVRSVGIQLLVSAFESRRAIHVPSPIIRGYARHSRPDWTVAVR